jgi:hypothetical protein
VKICKKCNIEKDFIYFYVAKNTLDGYRGSCIDCMKNYYINNSERIIKQIEKHKDSNKEHYKSYFSVYYLKNKDKIKENNNNYYFINKQEVSLRNKIYREKNIDKIKIYRLKNKDKIRKLKREYNIIRKNIDPLYKLICNIRTLVSNSIRKFNFSKKSKTSIILGCSFDEFKIHIENQFDVNMNWNNYGSYWQIDHIYPVSKYENEEHLIKLNHYTNLRPLESSENNKKNNKIYEI